LVFGPLEELKAKFFTLLKEDIEFRYAVAGMLGLEEILRRMDRHEEALEKHTAEIVRLREDMLAGFKRHDEVLAKHSQEIVKLREDFNRMFAEFKDFSIRLSRVERTLEKLTVDVEDEARSVLKSKLKEIGIGIELTSLILPGLELNIYGVSDDVCVIGEATIRAGAGIVDELFKKLDKLKANHPERLKRKVVLVVYVSLPMAELIEKAKERGIWLLKATEEFHKPEKYS